jgi:hypothetical protein
MKSTHRLQGCFLLAYGLIWSAAGATTSALRPVVEVEEEVYSYQPADNGAGPLWCSGSSCLVRSGDALFASGLETLPDCPPLNNCRWTLFQRHAAGWHRVQADPNDRTREPAPLAIFAGGPLFLSANPTLRTNREAGGGPAQPQILQFSTAKPEESWRTMLPVWNGAPAFSEHSYRSLAADGPNRELILFQNIDYTHAEWSFLDREGRWSAQGKLRWPWGAEYDKPGPVRICYPTVALHNGSVHFCGVSDIIEPYYKWREFKRQLTGREWDYDFRRLFYTWSPDIRTGQFRGWVEIASRDQTCGWVSPADLWVGPDDVVHILWTERALDERLRPTFFPDAKQSHALKYARVRHGEVLMRSTLAEAREGESGEIPAFARFQVAPDNRLMVFYYVHGSSGSGAAVSENRLLEILPDGTTTRPVSVGLKHPFTGGFTATVRAGSAPARELELLGQRAGKPNSIGYARIRLW